MFPYILVFLFVAAVLFFFDKSSNRIYTYGITIIVLGLSSFAAVRDLGVGTDTLFYTEEYYNYAKLITNVSELLSNDAKLDIGYLLLNVLSVKVGEGYWAPLLLTALMINGLIIFGAYKILKTNRTAFCWFVFLYITMFYNQTFNYMRQLCAVGILIWGFYYLLNRKWFLYIILQILATSFHSSALLFVLIPIFDLCMSVGNKYIKYGLIIVGLGLVLYGYFNYYVVLSLLNTKEVVSDVYAERYGAGNMYEEGRLTTINNIVLYLFYSYTVLKCFTRNYLQGKDRMYFIVNLGLYLIFFLFSTYAFFLFRLSFYFSIIAYIYISLIMSEMNVRNNPQNVLIILFFIYYWYKTYIVSNACETFPFTSKILGIS